MNSCHKHYSQSQLLRPSFYRGNFPLELSPKGSKSMSKEFEYSWSSTLQHCKSRIKNNNFTNESTKHFPLTNQSFEGIHKIIIAPLKMLILSPSKTKEFQESGSRILWIKYLEKLLMLYEWKFLSFSILITSMKNVYVNMTLSRSWSRTMTIKNSNWSNWSSSF